MQTFLFYDLETSGLNKAFDQILQFAAIRTDLELVELERTSINIRMRPDIVLSPGAAITHRISLEELLAGDTEVEALQKIHRLFNRPGTVSTGYNSLGFDDEFVRFSFYRNLLPPYTHQYENGCRRMDILPMTVLYYLYRPHILKWPQKEGRTILKLEYLSGLNGLSEKAAHDAMADTEATLALARRMLAEKEMWDYLNGFFFKQTDGERMEKLPVAFESEWGRHTCGIMTGSEFGPDLSYQVPVLSIGKSIPYSNQTLWLRIDSESLRQTDIEDVAATTRVIRKRLGEPGLLLPPRDRFLHHMGEERHLAARENIRWLRDNQQVFDAIIRYYQEFAYPEIPDVDADAALYQTGFLSRKDQELCRRFHEGDLAEKELIATQFSRKATRQLATRVIGRNFPEASNEKGKLTWRHYLEAISPAEEGKAPVDYRGEQRLTPRAAQQEIDRLTASGEMDQEQHLLLEALAAHLKVRFSLKS